MGRLCKIRNYTKLSAAAVLDFSNVAFFHRVYSPHAYLCMSHPYKYKHKYHISPGIDPSLPTPPFLPLTPHNPSRQHHRHTNRQHNNPSDPQEIPQRPPWLPLNSPPPTSFLTALPVLKPLLMILMRPQMLLAIKVPHIFSPHPLSMSHAGPRTIMPRACILCRLAALGRMLAPAARTVERRRGAAELCASTT